MIPELKGGIGLPDILKYHRACQLTWLIDWNIHSDIKAWVQLEHTTAQIPLRQLLWLPPKHIPLNCRNHLLINPLLVTFQEACRKYNILSTLGPMMPLCQNPDFSPGISTTFLVDTWLHQNIRVEQFYERGRFISLSLLSSWMLNRLFPLWSYFLSICLLYMFIKEKTYNRCGDHYSVTAESLGTVNTVENLRGNASISWVCFGRDNKAHNLCSQAHSCVKLIECEKLVAHTGE